MLFQTSQGTGKTSIGAHSLSLFNFTNRKTFILAYLLDTRAKQFLFKSVQSQTDLKSEKFKPLQLIYQYLSIGSVLLPLCFPSKLWLRAPLAQLFSSLQVSRSHPRALLVPVGQEQCWESTATSPYHLHASRYTQLNHYCIDQQDSQHWPKQKSKIDYYLSHRRRHRDLQQYLEQFNGNWLCFSQN